MVHHITVYLQLPELKDAVDELDAADSGPGYDCPSGPGFTNNMFIAGYAPGVESTLPKQRDLIAATGDALRNAATL